MSSTSDARHSAIFTDPVPAEPVARGRYDFVESEHREFPPS